MSEHPDVEREAIDRDRRLAWELFTAQPQHPRIPQLAQSVLARDPHLTGMIILLSRHRTACGDIEGARALLQELMGRRDRQYLNALRDLRDLEESDSRYAEHLRLAQLVLREDPEANWRDRMDVGAATALAVDSAAGWALIDDAVELCARTDPDGYADALALRAGNLLTSSAPPERFLVAAEQAIEADPTEPIIAVTLAYAYLYAYRPEEAVEILLRVLRLDPTDEFAHGGMAWAKVFSAPLESGAVTIEDLRNAGMGEIVWREVQHWTFGTSVEEALLTLEAVMPNDLAQSLHPPLAEEAAQASGNNSKVLAWRDGQLPGTGVLWRDSHSFRLMTSAEICEMEDAIERHPENWLEWGAGATDYFQILFTDDTGAYLIEGPGGRLYRRAAGKPDQEAAASLADWIWDRVAAFGGADPRPGQAADTSRVR